jgi:hypothetical protein
VLRAGGDQKDDQASPCCPGPSPPVDGTRQASPVHQGVHAAVRVQMLWAVDALEGKGGTQAYAAVEQDGYLVLRRGEGDALLRMPLCSLELVDIGERRVVIVPNLEPTELTLDDLGLLEVETDLDFWGMIPSRRATYRNVQGAKVQPEHTRPIAHQLPRRVNSRRARLPPIPEVPRAEASVTDSSAAVSSDPHRPKHTPCSSRRPGTSRPGAKGRGGDDARLGGRAFAPTSFEYLQ